MSETASQTGHGHMIRTISVTVIATVIVALGTGIILQGRELARQEVRIENLDEKVAALAARINQLKPD